MIGLCRQHQMFNWDQIRCLWGYAAKECVGFHNGRVKNGVRQAVHGNMQRVMTEQTVHRCAA